MFKTLPDYITKRDLEDIIDELKIKHPRLKIKIKRWGKPYTLFIRDEAQDDGPRLIIMKEQTPRELAEKLGKILVSDKIEWSDI